MLQIRVSFIMRSPILLDAMVITTRPWGRFNIKLHEITAWEYVDLIWSYGPINESVSVPCSIRAYLQLFGAQLSANQKPRINENFLFS